MTEVNLPESQEILSILRRLDGFAFAGQLGPSIIRNAADCSCQNCGCDSRSGDGCGCKPNCRCQGYTADRMDRILDPLLGLAAVLPIEDIQTLVGFRDKLAKSFKKLG
ncbi:hypothetical protein EH221_04495 [bacterium]|nr:MAG: hypothetical protein EH221_04495 [bacterium]